ncbi:MAG TPA: glycoside hydrolase family 3 N-terminal domain-containing protein [Terriglobia bacterium]|nr:glycoside hydrolase family 3 N-terminal domain-containing protein [Terriglobia bacterium]
MRSLGCWLVILSAAAGAAAQQAVPDYKNPALPIQQRVADLLPRMTLEEKVGQLTPGRPRPGQAAAQPAFPPELLQTLRKMFSVDSDVSPHDAAEARNAIQKFMVEKTRLGIPALSFGEALHGYMFKDSTSFPQVLGLASTWDPDLVRQAFTAIADEMASSGANQAFTPVLDLARDPRWGRTEETYGEDPYLVSRMGVAAIEGLQGPNYLIDRHHVMATAKHFAAHGQPEGGTNTAPANFSERILRESFLVPFQAAVQEAHVGSVMASYNEIDGVPSHINKWLLDKVLRQEWGFGGYVTSDGGGLQMLVNTHHVAADNAQAAREALAAGVDYDLSDGSVYNTITEQVHSGAIPVAELDKAVARVLAAKFRLGLFENPYVNPDYAQQISNSPEHRKLALRVAQEAIVLLKNDGNLLPLNLSNIKSVAVIGPNAADVHLGGYSREPAHSVSILQGIRDRVGPSVKVLYSEGCKISVGRQGWRAWYDDEVKFPDPQSQLASIQAAVETARQADVAIVVVGENESTNREAWSEKHLGDRDSLNLIGAQDQLIKAVVETGKPTIVFLINGRPLSINYAAEHVPAILEGWYLGQEGGTAAAQVLFGDVNPGGKLPITFPRSVGELPDYYYRKPSANRSYLGGSRKPLFPFGYGLSYTTFHFDNLRVDPPSIGQYGSATVRVDVTNTGTREGDEVAQMYIHQRLADVTQPVMKLCGFRRVHLKPGEKATVEFPLTPELLSVLDINMHRVVEPGLFDIMAGPSSAETTSIPLQVGTK